MIKGDQLHDINWGALDYAFRASHVTSMYM